MVIAKSVNREMKDANNFDATDTIFKEGYLYEFTAT
jgi:hypothetical protein